VQFRNSVQGLPSVASKLRGWQPTFRTQLGKESRELWGELDEDENHSIDTTITKKTQKLLSKTRMTIKNQPFEDVSPIKNMVIFPACHVSFRGVWLRLRSFNEMVQGYAGGRERNVTWCGKRCFFVHKTVFPQ